MTDFITAVRPVADQWATSYRIFHQEKINANTITYQEVIEDFQKEMSIHLAANPKGKGRVGKGAFGPTFADEEAPDQPQPQAGGSQKNRGKKRQSEEDDSSDDKCPAYDMKHKLQTCYYAFPDRAPKWWKPNSRAKATFEERMKSDSMKDQIQAITRKRPRTKSQTPHNQDDHPPKDED